MRSDAVKIRSVKQSNFLHGKMYLTGTAGVVGSSNFTKNGLGGSDRPNLEINLAVTEAELLAELQEWFDDLWADQELTYNVKQQVLDALNRLGQDLRPGVHLLQDALRAVQEQNRCANSTATAN